MSEQYTYSKNGVDFIMHADSSSHKYVAKTYLGNGHYRYFYSQAEYQAYLKNQSANSYDDAYNKTSEDLNYAKDSVDQATDMAKNFSNNSANMAKNAASGVANDTYSTNKQAADKATNFTAAISDMVSSSAKSNAGSVSGTINAGVDFFKSLFN